MVAAILIMLPLPSFSGTVFVTICFYLSILVTAYTLGYLTQKRAVLHGVLSVGIALPTVAFSTFLLLSTIGFHMSPPGDWRLIQRFEQNEPMFNDLRDPVQKEDGLESISSEYKELDDSKASGISPKQLENYRKAMKRLGIISVSKSRSFEGVSFSLKRNGFLTYKGYVYRRIPPPLKQMVEKTSGEVIDVDGVYRSLGDGWYLYAKAVFD